MPSPTALATTRSDPSSMPFDCAPAARTTASAHPAARRSTDVGGPARSTSTTSMPGSTEVIRSTIPSVRTTWTIPDPSARIPAAIGGRFGAQRQQSSRDHRASTGRPCSCASSRAAAGTGLWRLAPNAPPFAAAGDGSPPGTHHDASVSTYAASTQLVRSVTVNSPSGIATGGLASIVVRRPWTLPMARRAAVTDSPTTHPPAGSRTATRASSGAVSAENPTAPATTSVPTRWGAPSSRVARREAASRSRSCTGARAVPSDRVSSHIEPRTSSAASTIVCQPVQRHRCAASARSTAPGRSPPPGSTALRRSVSRRTTMPGEQNPHWLAPWATKDSVQRSRTSSSIPSKVVT